MERGAGDKARLRAARRTGMHDDVRHHVLLDEFPHCGDEAQCADWRRRAKGNEKRIAALLAEPREHLLRRLGTLVARRDVFDLAPSICASNKLPVGRMGGTPFKIRTQWRPSLAAVAAVARAWFDWIPPTVTIVFAPSASA